MNIKTFPLLALTNKSATFTTDTVDVRRDKGCSVSIHTESSSSLSMGVHIEATVCENDRWAIIPGSQYVITGDDDLVYNIPDVYYLGLRVVFTFSSGSTDLAVDITTKSH